MKEIKEHASIIYLCNIGKFVILEYIGKFMQEICKIIHLNPFPGFSKKNIYLN